MREPEKRIEAGGWQHKEIGRGGGELICGGVVRGAPAGHPRTFVLFQPSLDIVSANPSTQGGPNSRYDRYHDLCQAAWGERCPRGIRGVRASQCLRGIRGVRASQCLRGIRGVRASQNHALMIALSKPGLHVGLYEEVCPHPRPPEAAPFLLSAAATAAAVG